MTQTDDAWPHVHPHRPMLWRRFRSLRILGSISLGLLLISPACLAQNNPAGSIIGGIGAIMNQADTTAATAAELSAATTILPTTAAAATAIIYVTKESDSFMVRSRQAGVSTQAFREAFETAYQLWREDLCEADLQGIPWADATGDRLLQEVRQQLRCLSRPLSRSKRDSTTKPREINRRA
jgi:hypothetical protein